MWTSLPALFLSHMMHLQSYYFLLNASQHPQHHHHRIIINIYAWTHFFTYDERTAVETKSEWERENEGIRWIIHQLTIQGCTFYTLCMQHPGAVHFPQGHTNSTNNTDTATPLTAVSGCIRWQTGCPNTRGHSGIRAFPIFLSLRARLSAVQCRPAVTGWRRSDVSHHLPRDQLGIGHSADRLTPPPNNWYFLTRCCRPAARCCRDFLDGQGDCRATYNRASWAGL